MMISLSPIGKIAASMTTTAVVGSATALMVAGSLGSPSESGSSNGWIDRREALTLITLGASTGAVAGLVALGVGAANINERYPITRSTAMMRTVGLAIGLGITAGAALGLQYAIDS